MSNHSGSYMLNAVLKTLDQFSVFESLGEEKSQELVRSIIKISHHFDCNPGEILEDIGEELGLCYNCCARASEFFDSLCKECHKFFERK